MPLARNQRIMLAAVMRWGRANGWKHDVYPGTWRSVDGMRHVRFDSSDTHDGDTLVIDRQTTDPLRCYVSLVPVENVEMAINVLAAIGYLPAHMAPMFDDITPGDWIPDEPDDDEQTDMLDSPACFLDAGQAFADWVDGKISSERAAEVLSRLAQQGLIVSAAYHDETCGGVDPVTELLGNELDQVEPFRRLPSEPALPVSKSIDELVGDFRRMLNGGDR